jgi:hypothetical protein
MWKRVALTLPIAVLALGGLVHFEHYVSADSPNQASMNHKLALHSVPTLNGPISLVELPQSVRPTAPPTCGGLAAPAPTIFGELRSCVAYGTHMIATTLGVAGKSGVIAVSEGAGWNYISPPLSGGVTVLAHPLTSVLIIDNAGAQMCFNLDTDTCDTDPSCH